MLYRKFEGKGEFLDAPFELQYIAGVYMHLLKAFKVGLRDLRAYKVPEAGAYLELDGGSGLASSIHIF